MKKINLNLISILISIIVLIISVSMIWNAKRIDYLKIEKEVLIKEKKSLSAENEKFKKMTDFSLYEKINSQREYYENEITKKDKEIILNKSKIDSIKANVKETDFNSKYHITSHQIKMIRLELNKCESDSLLLKNYILLDNIRKEMLSLKNKQIKVMDIKIQILYKKIDLYKEKIGLYEKYLDTNYNNITFIFVILILLGLLLIILIKDLKFKNNG